MAIYLVPIYAAQDTVISRKDGELALACLDGWEEVTVEGSSVLTSFDACAADELGHGGFPPNKYSRTLWLIPAT